MRIMRIFLADRARHTRSSVLDFQLLIVASACFVVVVMGTNVGASSLWRRIWCRFRTVLTRCGESTTEREFRPHHVYGRRDRLVVGVESLSRHGLGFVSVLDVRFFRAVPSRSLAAVVVVVPLMIEVW